MKKGISLIILAVTIIIATLLVTTVTISGKKTMDNAIKVEFGTELEMVQESVDNYYSENGSYPTLDLYNFSTVAFSSIELEQFEGENINSSNIDMYELDMSKLVLSDLSYGNRKKNNDVYLVSSITGRVYYAAGVTIAENRCYTLTDDIKRAINYVETNNVHGNDITFHSSTDEWTNSRVATTINVPTTYKDVSVTAIKDNNLEYTIKPDNTTLDGSKYVVDSIDGNYAVVVNYLDEESTDKKSKMLNITNCDTSAPIVEISDVKVMKNSDTGEEYRYINIVKKQDDLSGIKYIKYANEYIEQSSMKEYFSSNGIVIRNDSISIDDGVSNITLYVEDNAGNYSFLNINV